MDKKYCAILMERVTLEENTYNLYKPICTIIGKIQDNVFITDDGKNISSIESISNFEHKYCFDNEILIEDLNKFYNKSFFNLEEQQEKYFEDYCRIIYISEYNYKIGKLDLHEIDLEDMNNKKEKIDYEFIKNIDNKKYIIDKKHDERQKDLEEVFKINEKTSDVKKLYEETKKVIKGQDEAIKNIVSAIKVDSFATLPSERNRCLIVGKTGCGKTEIIRTIGSLIDRPFVRTDSTQITVAGYVGGTIEGNILLPLLSMCSGNQEAAERGIVALDEIDKKGSSSNDDVAGRGVLNSLLPFLDGTEFNVKYNNRTYRFDTSKLTIFALGAFMNILDYKTKNVLGFNSQIIEKKEVTLDDFSKIGMMPNEFIGRFPVLIMMNELTLDNYIDILVNSKNSVLKFYERFFKEMYNINLKYTDKFIEELALKAMNLKTGARSLKRIIEESINDVRWDVMTSDCQYNEIILDEQTVNNSKIYKIR